MTGSLKTSLIQSRLSERKARGSSRSRGTQSVLTGIVIVFYQNAYHVTAVSYGVYPIRETNPANLAPLGDGDLNCVAQRVVDHFKGALRSQGLTPVPRRKIQEWENGVHEGGAAVNDVVEQDITPIGRSS